MLARSTFFGIVPCQYEKSRKINKHTKNVLIYFSLQMMLNFSSVHVRLDACTSVQGELKADF